MSKTLETRLTKLETTNPADDAACPVLIVRDGETAEQAAARLGIDPASVVYQLPDNGRDR